MSNDECRMNDKAGISKQHGRSVSILIRASSFGHSFVIRISPSCFPTGDSPGQTPGESSVLIGVMASAMLSVPIRFPRTGTCARKRGSKPTYASPEPPCTMTVTGRGQFPWRSRRRSPQTGGPTPAAIVLGRDHCVLFLAPTQYHLRRGLTKFPRIDLPPSSARIL
jgi:hypothetical protein